MSDLARVYAAGKEPAIGGQSGGKPAAAGKELATAANSNTAQVGKDIAR